MAQNCEQKIHFHTSQCFSFAPSPNANPPAAKLAWERSALHSTHTSGSSQVHLERALSAVHSPLLLTLHLLAMARGPPKKVAKTSKAAKGKNTENGRKPLYATLQDEKTGKLHHNVNAYIALQPDDRRIGKKNVIAKFYGGTKTVTVLGLGGK